MSLIVADLNEIVFRLRNRDYGAYVLRKEYGKNTRNALIIGISIFVLAIVFPLIWNAIAPDLSDENAVLAETEVVLEEPPPMDEEQEMPEEVFIEPPPPPARSQIQFVPPEVVAHEEAPKEVTIASIDTLQQPIDVGTENRVGDMNAPPDIGFVQEGGTGKGVVEAPPPPKEREPDPDEFISVEKEAAPVNLDDIKKSLTYPEICRQMQIQGKVVVKVLVGKDGRVQKHIIKKTPHELMSNEVVKNLSKLAFTPAIQAGKPTQMWVVVPFDFRLN